MYVLYNRIGEMDIRLLTRIMKNALTYDFIYNDCCMGMTTMADTEHTDKINYGNY